MDRYIITKYAKREQFNSYAVDIAGHNGFLIVGTIESEKAEWCTAIEAIADIPVSLPNKAAAGALIVKVDEKTYALTYGMGFLLLKPELVEPNFGLRFAVRSLDPDEVRQITRHVLDNRTQINRNSVPTGQHVRGFGIEEYGEIVSRLVGRAKISGFTFSSAGGPTFSFSASDSLSLPLAKSAENLVADLKCISAIISNESTVPELDFIDRVKALRGSDPRVDTLNAQLTDALAKEDSQELPVALAYPHERDEDHGEAQSYLVRIAGRPQPVADLNIGVVGEFLAAVRPENRMEVLRKGYIQACKDAEATEPISRQISALKWISAEASIESSRFFFHQGKWYEVGQDYVDYLSSRVRHIFDVPPPLVLPPWSPVIREEKDYNKAVASGEGYTVMDRKLLHTEMHPKGFEVCDLLGPNDELIHVKRATGSDSLSHLFAQGYNAAEQLWYHEEARWKMAEKLRSLDPDRSYDVGRRPAELVYAIQIPGSTVTPERLFSFSKVALVRAFNQLDLLGVRVSVLNIPE